MDGTLERHNAQVFVRNTNEQLEKMPLTEHGLAVSLLNSLLQHRQILAKAEQEQAQRDAMIAMSRGSNSPRIVQQ